MAYPVTDLRIFLGGTWRIARRIRDDRLAVLGRLTGRATFAPAPGGLVYDEDGALSFGAHQGPATRRYHLAIDQPSIGEMRHADGSLFHMLDLTSGAASVLHRCGDDNYRGRYRVIGGDCFFVNWRVSGPRKDYASTTRYRRASAGVEDAPLRASLAT
jgi:hypothetical protein